MVCLGNECRSFCRCWDCTQLLDFGLFCWLWVLLHFPKRSLLTVVDMMVFWIKFTHPVLISSLIPKLSGFTLAISCLSTSNLPWFMDLTFQVPMQYYSLQHQTLFSPPATSGHCFHFGSASSFLLELFLHSSPVAYWTPTNLEVHLSVSYIFAFSCCSWVLKARIMKWFAILFSSGPRFVRTLHHDLSVLDGPTWHGT